MKHGKLVRLTRSELAKIRQTGSLLYKAALPQGTNQQATAREEASPRPDTPNADRNSVDIAMEDPAHTPIEGPDRLPQPTQESKAKRSRRNIPRIDYSVLDGMASVDYE